VYEAFDPIMKRRVALKELAMPPNLAGEQRRSRIERFYREARAAGTLTHANIVTIYEVGEEQGRHFIAMEYLEGESLRDRLQTAGVLSLEEAVRIAAAVAGRKPFTRDSVITITYNIMNLDPSPAAGAPPQVQQVIRRAMAKNPGQRYRTAAEMAGELRGVSTRGLPASSAPAQRPALPA